MSRMNPREWERRGRDADAAALLRDVRKSELGYDFCRRLYQRIAGEIDQTGQCAWLQSVEKEGENAFRRFAPEERVFLYSVVTVLFDAVVMGRSYELQRNGEIPGIYGTGRFGKGEILWGDYDPWHRAFRVDVLPPDGGQFWLMAVAINHELDRRSHQKQSEMDEREQQAQQERQAQQQQELEELRRRLRAYETEEKTAEARRAALLRETQVKAESDYNARLAQANEEAEAIRASAREEARRKGEEQAQRIAREWLIREQQAQREHLSPQTAEAAAEECNDWHSALCEESGAIQRSVNRMLEELTGIKHEMEDQLIAWRRSLYQQEFGTLAQAYKSLYRLCDKMDAEIAETALRTEGEDGMVEKLRNQQRQLHSVLERLEKGMGRLGLYVVVPQAGEPYNAEWHEENELEEAAEGAPIRRVSTPAVAWHDAIRQEEHCVSRAAVSVNEQERG